MQEDFNLADSHPRVKRQRKQPSTHLIRPREARTLPGQLAFSFMSDVDSVQASDADVLDETTFVITSNVSTKRGVYSYLRWLGK